MFPRSARALVSLSICAAATCLTTAATAVPAPIPGAGPQHEAEFSVPTLPLFAGFGGSVAISGDTMFASAPAAKVGATLSAGEVYVYTKPASGWTTGMQPTAILTDGTGGEDEFGGGLAVSGNTLVVGAPGATQSATTNVGAAFVFTKPNTGWATTATPTSELYASDGAASSAVGTDVAISGDTVVVGADNQGGSGAAYVFVKPGAGWTPTMSETAKLTGTFSDSGDDFGDGVGISGDTIVVTAPDHKDGSAAGAGLGYVFVKPAAGWVSMTQTRKLEPSDAAANEGFGGYHETSISGGTIAVGSTAGAFYVFTEPAGGWGVDTPTLTETKRLAPINTPADAATRPAVVGTNIAVGVGEQTNSNESGAGVVFVYSRPSSGGWGGTVAFPAILSASNPEADDNFGGALPAIDGTTVVVGAPYAVDDRGAAYVYTPAAPTLSKVTQKTTAWKLGGKGTSFRFKLDEAATVKLAFAHKHRGHYKKVGSIALSAPIGKTKEPFNGTIAKGVKLPAGKAEVVIAAANANGTSKPVTLKFTTRSH